MKRKLLVLIFILYLFFNMCNSYATDESITALNIYSEAAILIDSKTGQILYEKNAYTKKYPASTTKILTAILAIENCNLNDTVTVTKSAISAVPAGYSSANLIEGEKITIQNLLIVFLVHSANDAGYVLAEHVSGSIDNFSRLMNEKVLSLGCENTHFTNPSGIHDDSHYTTAYDLSLIAKYCMQNETFRNLVSMQTCTIPSTNKSTTRKYSNTNNLIDPSSKFYLKECIGIKTGYTSEARNCLVSSCIKDNLELICVVLDGDLTFQR